jgi:hypothetical protein
MRDFAPLCADAAAQTNKTHLDPPSIRRNRLRNMSAPDVRKQPGTAAAEEHVVRLNCFYIRRPLSGVLLAALLATSSRSRADPDVSDQAKEAQNPIANLISVPLQSNTNLNVGPERGTLNVLNVEPIIPVSLGHDWSVITRTIVPVISEPPLSPEGSRINGIGDTLFSAFLSPRTSRGWIWGVGPAVQVPTHSNTVLGNNNWGLGPTFVVLHLEAGSPWVYGVLVNNVWSIRGSHVSHAYDNGLMQPFVNFNLGHGSYLVSAPIITVNWTAAGSQQWTVPLGGGVGQIVHWGKVPVNMQLSGYYNIAHPTEGPNWQVRTQIQFLFPK